MNKQKQNGSALAIIVIILIVAVIVALGFAVWQNSTVKDTSPTQSTPSNQNSPVVPLRKFKTAQIDDTFPAKLSWIYPESWTIKSEGSGPKNPSDTTTQKFTITSPSSKYEVIYYVGINGGLGGACEPGSDKLQLVESKPVTNFSKSIFLETISGSSNGYAYKSALYQNDTNTQSISEGDSMCKIYLRNVIPLTEDGNMVILAAEINIKQFDSTDRYGPTEIYPKDISTIEKTFLDSEYKDAVRILLSTTSN